MAAQREFDIVLYGATGFAGKLTADYLAKAGGDTRIALAGRSQDKLLAVRETLGEAAQSWPLIAADALQPSTLDEMAARAQVVVTTVGPYARYGLPLVAACAAAGTDYADLTGESMFIRESIDLYHKQAIETGARIVHSCGFDSIPSDLTVFALYRRAEHDQAGQLGNTNMVVRALAGGVSGGTVASMIEFLRTLSSDPEARRLMNDPYTLTPERAAEPQLGAQPDVRWRRGREIAPELEGYWAGAFLMAAPKLPNCPRSNALLDYAIADGSSTPSRWASTTRSPRRWRQRCDRRDAATLALGGRVLARVRFDSSSASHRIRHRTKRRRPRKGHYTRRILHHHHDAPVPRAPMSQKAASAPGHLGTARQSGFALTLDRDRRPTYAVY